MPDVRLEDAQWFYTAGEKQAGPVPSFELRELALSGQLRPTDLVFKEGARDWIPARDVAGLFDREVDAAAEQDRQARRRGLFRDGDILVVRKGAPLPPRCVKTNQPTAAVLKRTFYYMSPWIYLLLLAHVLIFIVVALLVRKTATLHVGLSEEAQAARRRGILNAWTAALAGVGMIVGAFPAESWWLGLAGAGVLMAAMIYGARKASVLSARLIDDQYAHLKGVCPEFLEDLPEWHAQRYR